MFTLHSSAGDFDLKITPSRARSPLAVQSQRKVAVWPLSLSPPELQEYQSCSATLQEDSEERLIFWLRVSSLLHRASGTLKKCENHLFFIVIYDGEIGKKKHLEAISS